MILAFTVTFILVLRLWSLNITFHLKGKRAIREMPHRRLRAGNVQNKPGLFFHTRKDWTQVGKAPVASGRTV